jgi:hypothetical protein
MIESLEYPSDGCSMMALGELPSLRGAFSLWNIGDGSGGGNFQQPPRCRIGHDAANTSKRPKT